MQMSRAALTFSSLLLVATPLTLVAAQAQPQVGSSESQAAVLPVYTLSRKPSALLTDRAGLDALARQVAADAAAALAKTDLPASQREQYEAAATQAALLLGDYDTALALAEATAARSKDGASSALAGFLTKGLIAARNGPADLSSRQQALASTINTALRPIPVPLVADRLKARRASFAAFDANVVVRGFAAQLDPVYARRKGLELPLATELLGTGFAMRVLPDYGPTLVTLLDAYLAAGTPLKPIWPERSFSLEPGTLTPVPVAIWDNGFDPKVFTGQVLAPASGADTSACGTLAFDQRLEPTTGDLLPLPSVWRGRVPEMLLLQQGSIDAAAGADTEAAAAYRARIAELDPPEMRRFFDSIAFATRYVHGQHIATIAAQDNPAIRLLNIRMETLFSLDEDRLAAFPEVSRAAVAHMRSCGVRVANLSWGISRSSLEAVFIAKGVEPDPAKRRARVERLYTIVSNAMRDAMTSAPDILFVVAAGNDGADLDAEEAVPASIKLPNVLTVGAVDQAGQRAGFTRSGSSVTLFANGVGVDVTRQGGARATFSGTSAAAPYVTNAAAKLMALRPDLTANQVADLLKSTADTSTTEGISLVDPNKARTALGEKVKP